MSRNRLTEETSPYLLQHQDNPVHWWAWGPDALAEAERLNKPILLSIGYAACHWCHVMAHESFEDEPTAAVMNDLFINIKVDREERPDIDTIYMTALHTLGEQGGWPLTMFLTPKAEPFWGGTYFPKETKYGRPSFVTVLKEVARLFREEPDKIAQNRTLIAERLDQKPSETGSVQLTEPLLARFAKQLVAITDGEHGGVRGAPKFPQSSFFWFLWRAGIRFGDPFAQETVRTTLENILQGGIYDHLGGGIARYSVDAVWLAPHFEKMLYDNAQLISLASEVWRETHDPLLKRRVEETVAWCLRDMRTDEGGFAASYDADSEGEEGKFYVWSKREILDLLGSSDGHFFAGHYDVAEGGNWEGKTILNRLGKLGPLSDADENRLAKLREILLQARAKRPPPGWDDKVLADWNGLLISALAGAGRIFDRADWTKAAQRAFQFIQDKMSNGTRLLHAYRAGRAKAPATLNDYANMIAAALALYQTTGETRYIDAAIGWTEVLDNHYWDPSHGGYFFTADDTTDVIMRTKSAADDAAPNGNGTMASMCMNLFLLTGENKYRNRAEAILNAFAPAAVRNLFAHTGLMSGALDVLAPQHVVILGMDNERTKNLLATLNKISLPGALLQILQDTSSVPKTSPAAGKTMIDDAPTAYICSGQTCSLPASNPEMFEKTIRATRSITIQSDTEQFKAAEGTPPASE